MKKSFILFLVVVSTFKLFAQYSIQPIIPTSGLIQKNQLWNILLINNTKSIVNCKVELILVNRITGMEELTASTNQIELGAGSKQMNATTLMPILYNSITSNKSIQNDDFLSIGSYTACYKLITGYGKSTDLVEECVSFDVEPLAPPMLTTPTDGIELMSMPSQFTWVPPSPINLFRNLNYDILFVEVYPNQKPEEAVIQNSPFYFEQFLNSNILNYLAFNSKFKIGKTYAWQVVAKEGKEITIKSDVWTFLVKEQKPLITKKKESPFVKVSMDNKDLAIVSNGILKISYDNRYSDSTITVNIKDISSSKNIVYTKNISQLRSGENCIQLNLKNGVKLTEGKIYLVQMINSKGEKWEMKFQVKN